MILSVDRKAFQVAVADIAKFRDTGRERDYPTYIRLAAHMTHGFFLEAIHLLDGICYRRELRARIGTDETSADAHAAVYVDLDALTKLPLRGARIDLTIETGKLIMQCGNVAITFGSNAIHSGVDWSMPDLSDAVPIDIFSGNRLAAMLKFVLVAAAKEETRPILTAIHMTFSANGLFAERRLTSADGFRLHMAHENVIGMENSKSTYELLLPAAVLKKAIKAIESSNKVFLFRRTKDDKSIIRMLFGYHELVFGETQGKFPAVMHLFDENVPLHMNADRGDLARLAADMVHWSKKNNYTGRFKGGTALVTGHNGTLEFSTDWEFKTTKTGKVTAMPEIALNTVYLKEALAAMPLAQGDLVLVRMRDGNSPISITGGRDDISYTAVIMPMATR